MELLAEDIFAMAAESHDRGPVLAAVADFFELVMGGLDKNHFPQREKVLGMLREWSLADNDKMVCWIPGVGDCSVKWTLPDYVQNVVSDLLICCSNYSKHPKAGIHHDVFGSLADEYSTAMSKKYSTLARAVLANHGIHMKPRKTET